MTDHDLRALVLLIPAALFLFAARPVRQRETPRPGPPPRLRPADPADLAIMPLFRFEPIDLNRADARTLARIPGIGPARAARIAALRQRMGGFTGLEDLLALRGVGKKTLRRLGRWLCVRRETGRGDRTAGPGRG